MAPQTEQQSESINPANFDSKDFTTVNPFALNHHVQAYLTTLQAPNDSNAAKGILMLIPSITLPSHDPPEVTDEDLREILSRVNLGTNIVEKMSRL